MARSHSLQIAEPGGPFDALLAHERAAATVTGTIQCLDAVSIVARVTLTQDQKAKTGADRGQREYADLNRLRSTGWHVECDNNAGYRGVREWEGVGVDRDATAGGAVAVDRAGGGEGGPDPGVGEEVGGDPSVAVTS